MEKTEISPPTGGFWRPFFVVLCFVPLYMTIGSVYGQSAGMLPQMMEGDSIIRINMEEATWIASIPTIGTCIAASLSGPVSDKYGRIRMTQIACFFMVLGYGIIAAAYSFLLVAIGRFFIGAAMGCSFTSSVHISEVTPPTYRGMFLSINPLFSSAGLVYMYIVGGYLPWNIASGITCLISIVGVVLTLLCYESPTWLVRRNDIKTARKSLKRIEGSANVEAKLKELQDIAESQPVSKFSCHVFAEPTVWKPYMMLFIMSVLQNGSGFYIVIYYTVNFMREFHSTFDALQIAVALGVVRLLGMSLASFLLRRMGRKTIGALSGFSSSVLLLLVYAYLRFENTMPYLHANSWIPIVFFTVYILTMTLGIFVLPWTMTYEVFPVKVRGIMCGACFCTMFFVMFFTVKAYNTLLDNLRLEGMILMFAVSSLLFGAFSVTMLVETHGRTLDEVQKVFAAVR